MAKPNSGKSPAKIRSRERNPSLPREKEEKKSKRVQVFPMAQVFIHSSSAVLCFTVKTLINFLWHNANPSRSWSILIKQKMSDPQIPPMEDAYNFFNAELNPDGSLARRSDPPTLPASPENNSDDSPLSRDIPLNAANNTFIRLFRPRSPPPATKLPLIIYAHGGGFVFFSAASIPFHKSCSRMSVHTPALIASLEYRLAPEHRLPAAYNDAMDAVFWARAQALSGGDPWMEELADFSRIFLMGSSSGGNMLYHTALRALDHDLRPMKIVQLIMNSPFFGGVERTGSELKYYNDRIIPLHAADLLWALSLPEGADRGHKYCDPFAGGGPDEEKIRRLPVTLVRGYSRDPLVDKQKEFVEMMVARGGHVVEKFIDGGHHAVELFDPKFAAALYDDVRDFVASVEMEKQDNKM